MYCVHLFIFILFQYISIWQFNFLSMPSSPLLSACDFFAHTHEGTKWEKFTLLLWIFAFKNVCVCVFTLASWLSLLQLNGHHQLIVVFNHQSRSSFKEISSTWLPAVCSNFYHALVWSSRWQHSGEWCAISLSLFRCHSNPFLFSLFFLFKINQKMPCQLNTTVRTSALKFAQFKNVDGWKPLSLTLAMSHVCCHMVMFGSIEWHARMSEVG